MDNLLKNAENLGSQAVSSVGNLLSGAANAIEAPFQSQPIQSPVPQAQTMPQAQSPVSSQPSGLQGLLASLPQETMGALNMASQMFQQGTQGVEKTVGGLVNNAKNFIAPQDNYKPDLSVHYNPQVDQGGVTPAFPAIQQYINNNGFHFADNIKTGNPVTDWMARIAAGVPQYIANSPLLAAKATGQAAQDITTGDMFKPNIAASDVANLGMPIATIATLGAAPEAASALSATEGFIPKVIQGVVGGVKIGAGFGAAGAVGNNRNVTNPLQYVENVVSGTIQGIGAGAFLGGTTGAISGLPDLYKKQAAPIVAQQAAQDIQSGDKELLNHEAIAPYKKALTIKDDQKTQGQLVNAISDIKTNGMIGDEEANNVINSISQKLLPKGLTDKLNSIQLADTWEYLLARVNGRVPEMVPTWMQPFDNAVFDVSGKKAFQSGFIKVPGLADEEAPITPQDGVSDTSSEANNPLSPETPGVVQSKLPQRQEAGIPNPVVSDQNSLTEPISDLPPKIEGQRGNGVDQIDKSIPVTGQADQYKTSPLKALTQSVTTSDNHILLRELT